MRNPVLAARHRVERDAAMLTPVEAVVRNETFVTDRLKPDERGIVVVVRPFQTGIRLIR